MRAGVSKRGFTILEVLMALSIFAIGIVSVIALFPIGILAQRQMIDRTRAALVTRQAIAVLKANRVAAALGTTAPYSTWSDADWVADEYPGDSGDVNSMYNRIGGTPVFRDIDRAAIYADEAPQGWQVAWTTWNEESAAAAAAVRPDDDTVDDRVFSKYAWSAGIYAQETSGTAETYSVQIAVFRGYDVETLSALGGTAFNDISLGSSGRGVIEADDEVLARALTRRRGYVRVMDTDEYVYEPLSGGNATLNSTLANDDTWYDGSTGVWPGPGGGLVPPGMTLILSGANGTIESTVGGDDIQRSVIRPVWHRVESVNRHTGVDRDRTRIILAEPLRSPSGAYLSEGRRAGVQELQVSENLVGLTETTIVD